MRTLEEVLEAHPLPLFKPDGSPSELTQMQKDDINALATLQRALGDLPVGYGKTSIATAVSLMLRQPATLIIVPPILVAQWVKWLQSIPGVGRVVRYEGPPAKRRDLVLRGARYVVSSFQIFKNDFDRLKAELQDPMTIVDECFPAKTQVATPEGMQDIDHLQVGQEVLTSAGPKRIMKVFKALAFQLSTLELSDGSKITCTPNHPVFTDLGWVRAADCEQRFVLPGAAVSDLWQGVREADLCTVACDGSGPEHRNDLLEILHDEEALSREPSIIPGGGRQDAGLTETRTKSSRPLPRAVERTAQSSDLENTQENGVGTTCAQGQRHRNDASGSTAGSAAQGIGIPLEPRSEPGNKAARLSDQLQARLCASSEENRAGGGRSEPCGGQAPGSGQEERNQAGRVRVVRVSTAECCGAGVPVFNLHVEGRHDYFAGGILVHNCQNLKNYKSQLFKAVRDFSNELPLLLMSGTIMSKPGDGYAYVKLNDPAVYRTYAMFENIHVAERDFFDQPTKWQHLDMLQANLDLSRVRRTKEEVHADLPKANYLPIEYDLHPEHMKLYRKLMDEQLIEVEEGKIDATTAGKLYSASQQIIANWGYFSDDETNIPRLFEVIDNVIDEIGLGQPVIPGDPPRSKLIVWGNFKRTIARIIDYFNAKGRDKKGNQVWRAVGAYGHVNSKENVRAFMEDDDVLVLVAHEKSAGAGLNPQGFCWEMLFAETPTTTIPFIQCGGRIDRTGQRYNPNIRLAIARGTIQESLLKNLFSNDELVNQAGGSKQRIKDLIFPR